MRTALEVLSNHEIQSPSSCIAWTLEFIIKLHDANVPLDYYSLQSSGISYGFGPTERAILATHKIDSKEESYDWPDFEQISKEDAKLGYPLVFSLPSYFGIDLMTSDFNGGSVAHGCIATHSGAHDYVCRAFGHSTIFNCSPQTVWSRFRAVSKPHYQIHCLRHRAAAVPF